MHAWGNSGLLPEIDVRTLRMYCIVAQLCGREEYW